MSQMVESQGGSPTGASELLRVLIIEDNPADAELIVATLKRAGRSLSFEVVDSPQELQQHLERQDYDVILSDHNLRTWTGMDALEILRRSKKDIPFVVVTATLGDEAAVEYIKNGAADYVLKDRLARLPIAIQQALQEKTLRDAVKASEQRFRELVQDLDAIVWEADLHSWQFSFVSDRAQAILGHPIQQWLTDPNFWSNHVHPEDRECAVTTRRKATSESRAQNFDYRAVSADGRVVWLRELVRVVPSRGDRGPQLRGLMIDITERKQLEQQFRQSQKMEAIGRLAGGIAHDFNNLLTVIQGYGEVLQEELKPAEERLHRAAEEICKAAHRAASLTRQLLAFSRRQVMEPKVLDLNQVVANVGKMLQRLIGEDIDLVTKPDAALGLVKADPGQIEQVIMNLAVNARDAMPEGGKVTIETANVELDENYAGGHISVQPGPYVMLAVSDTGTGMDAETQSHVFEPFFTTKEPGKGTGLGLATVYGIVKQSGGYIWLYSEPGKGTAFKIYLPRVDEPAEVTGKARKPVGEPARASETILLVEDERSLRELASLTLQRYGYTVLEAPDAAQALRIAQQHQGQIQILVTDVVMPDMGGRELATHLARLRPEMKVLYISGYPNQALLHRGVLETGLAFLQKPFTAADLTRRLREVLDTEPRNS